MAILGGCGEEAPRAERQPAAVRVQTAQRSEVFSSVSLTGEIRARVETDLGFRFTGQIATRSVDVGNHVEMGQVLATLDSTQQQADVDAASASVVSAEAQLTQTSANLERQQSLLDQGFTTQSNFDEASTLAQTAQAALASAKADLASAQDRLANTELRADAAGLIVARNAEAGQVVAAAQAVFTLARDGPRDAVFNIYESLLIEPPAKDGIEVALLSDPSVKAVGTVREIAPAIDPATGTIRVKIGVDSTPPEMRLGAAVAGVGQFRKRDVFVLPWTAFFVHEGKPAVWLVDRASRVASLRFVTVDSYRTKELLVSDGLKDGDTVIVAGAPLLRPGEVVAPLAAGESATGNAAADKPATGS